MEAAMINIKDDQWQAARSYPAGAEEKVLAAGDSTTPRAIVLKIPPGWSMDAHSHIFAELHYIIDGQYESQDETYPAGTFRLIPEEIEHGPFSTKTGAVILVIWCKMKK